jgi:hypothetical protein
VNTHEAKFILARYRPGTADPLDPEMEEALKVAARDLQLGKWLEDQIALHAAARQGFRQLPVPEGLRGRILALAVAKSEPGDEQEDAATGWMAMVDSILRNWIRLAVAAAVLILLGLSGMWWPESTEGTQLADFRGRMVRTALREYVMDIHTTDMEEVRRHLQARNAPADYRLPSGFESLSVAGGGLLRWRNEPVSMVCFDQGGGELLFLFIIDRASVRNEPGSHPEFEQVNRLMTASWSVDDRVYLLAGEVGESTLRGYFWNP